MTSLWLCGSYVNSGLDDLQASTLNESQIHTQKLNRCSKTSSSIHVRGGAGFHTYNQEILGHQQSV